MFKVFYKKISLGLAVLSAYFLSALPALAAQTSKERCDAFKTQFAGAFDWVPDAYCTATGIGLYLIQMILSITGIVAIVFIILGGFWYLTSAGNEEQAEKGRKSLVNAVIGLVVVLMAFTIVRIVANVVGGGK